MAIVKTIKCQNGATVHICDDYYASRTPEQQERDREIAFEELYRIAYNVERRKQGLEPIPYSKIECNGAELLREAREFSRRCEEGDEEALRERKRMDEEYERSKQEYIEKCLKSARSGKAV